MSKNIADLSPCTAYTVSILHTKHEILSRSPQHEALLHGQRHGTLIHSTLTLPFYCHGYVAGRLRNIRRITRQMLNDAINILSTRLCHLQLRDLQENVLVYYFLFNIKITNV